MINNNRCLYLLLFAMVVTTGATTLSARCSTPAAADAHSALPKSVTVLGKKLVLKDHQGKPGQTFIAEYIPGGETFENWSLMFATRFVPDTNLDPMISAEATAKRIQARKQSGEDSLANAAVYKAPDGKSVVVDFLMSTKQIVEHNIFRYYKAPNGLVSQQIARREYMNDTSDEDIKGFISSIKTKRAELLKECMRADLPHGD